MDFVHDQLATGKTLRVLTIVDTFSRFSPALEPRFTFRGADVVEVLERVGRQMGLPATIRVDQGTEFVSRDLDLWAYQRGVTLDFSRPTTPCSKRSMVAYLIDDPRLVFVAPRSPTTGTGEHLEPMNRLSDSIIYCDHSKPNGFESRQTRRSEHLQEGDRATPLTVASGAECLNADWLSLADAQEKLEVGVSTTTRCAHMARLGRRRQSAC